MTFSFTKIIGSTFFHKNNKKASKCNENLGLLSKHIKQKKLWATGLLICATQEQSLNAVLLAQLLGDWKYWALFT